MTEPTKQQQVTSILQRKMDEFQKADAALSDAADKFNGNDEAAFERLERLEATFSATMMAVARAATGARSELVREVMASDSAKQLAASVAEDDENVG